ncbi:bifunctional 2',3'-cyclic nucleotide 2'-phosphodiesterase/3'-nucleotidase precursor protein [Halolamina pelagica]|uniref:Bifunctional 2',3'-cyclic nucleotide 2'-phosphodiesterase/3'-nucleotidase protein n=1 Tax=Halolamina pelagica TaxID=699431 RepID=A0A0P7G9G3_9EURY|nr:5'-nucleotidase C-terminal domain-containing protein [Halolamina pelagica]KPN29961.1 bifunctional 2',3'-cyclic nucleotide 2'-phosphodiesterase/3'-nucleotidase precursor protein [Halolamina pelagica]
MTTDAGAAGPRLLVINDVETAVDHPERIGRLAGAVDALRDDRTAVLDAGDATAMGALAFTTDTGRGQIAPLHRALAPDAHVPGNHDFDYGPDWLAGFAAATPGRWLGANVDGGEHLDLPDSVTLDIGDRTVAVVGLVTPETPELCFAVDDLEFTDPIRAATEAIADLPPSVDHVVVLSHCGPLDEEIARAVDADAVVGAHDHERVVEHVDGTLVARTAGVGHELLEVELRAEAMGEIHETADYPVSGPIAEAYRARLDAAGLDDRLATLDAPLTTLETAGFVADAYRAEAETPSGERGADVGFVLEASVRESIAGEVTTGDLIGTVPFGSELVTLAVDAADLRAALRATQGPIDATHGLGVWANADPNSATVGGEPVPDGETVTVGTTSYEAYNEILPGFSEQAIVANAGAQHERILSHARNGGLGAVNE